MRLPQLTLHGLLAITLFAAPRAIPAQSPAAPDSAPSKPRVPCANSADPRRRNLACNTGEKSRFDMAEQTLAADWAGARAWTVKHGITPTLSVTFQPMTSNTTVAGGRGWSWVTQVNLGIAFDLGKVAKAGGLQLYAGMAYLSGPSLSDKIGSLYTVQSAAGGYGFWAGELYLQQTVDDGRLSFAIGRLTSSPSFASLPVAFNYLNSAVGWGNPNALGLNDANFTGFPLGIQWGAQVVYQLTPTVELGLGLYNNDPDAAAGYEHGFHFTLQDGNVGSLVVAQVSWMRNAVPASRGLPGQYTLGFYRDGDHFAVLPSGADSATGMYNIYAMFQQMVTRDGGPQSDRGLTVWTTASWTAQSSIARMPWSAAGGLSYTGLIASRGKDIASFGAYYGSVSHSIAGAARELAIELNYQYVMRRWITVTPDAQYISRPGGTASSLPSAMLLGVQAAIVF
jgi:carbohydrate-selective porin OprB